MKLNIDLSNTEFSTILSTIQSSARREAELTTELNAVQNRIYTKQDEMFALNEKVRALEAEKISLTQENTRFRTALGSGHHVGAPDSLGGQQFDTGSVRRLLEAGSLMHVNSKIAAIKIVREIANIGLKEAKDLCESMTIAQASRGW
jgi:hypothetical protein